MALGTQPADILLLIVGQGLSLCVIGIVIGLGAALAGGRLVSSLFYDVDTHDPFTLTGVSIVLLLIGGLACYLPARRSMRIDPMEALRYE